MTLLVLACLLVSFGVGLGLLRYAWRNRLELELARREMTVAAGWGLLTLGTIGTAIYGGDSGAAAAIALIILMALSQFARNGWHAAFTGADSDAPSPIISSALSDSQSGQSTLRRIAIFILAGPIAAITAMLITLSMMAFFRAAHLSEADVIFLGLTLAPLLWAAGVAYAAIDPNLMRRAAILCLPGAGAALHLAFST